MTRRLLSALVLLTLCIIASPLTAGAYDAFPKLDCSASAKAQQSTVCSTGSGDPIAGPNGVLIKAAYIISYVAGAIAIIMIIIGGIRFMIADGDPAAVKSAKGTVVNSLIGLTVIALAYSLITFVVTKL